MTHAEIRAAFLALSEEATRHHAAGRAIQVENARLHSECAAIGHVFERGGKPVPFCEVCGSMRRRTARCCFGAHNTFDALADEGNLRWWHTREGDTTTATRINPKHVQGA